MCSMYLHKQWAQRSETTSGIGVFRETIWTLEDLERLSSWQYCENSLTSLHPEQTTSCTNKLGLYTYILRCGSVYYSRTLCRRQCRVLSSTIRNFPLTYRKLWHKHQLQSFSLKWFKIGLNWIFHFATCMFFHSCCFLNAWESRWTLAHVAVCVHTLQGSSAFGQTSQRSAGASAYSTCVVCGVCAHTQQTHTREHYSQRKLGCFKHQQSACQMRERREHLPRLDENPKTWRTLRLMWKWIIQILWVASCLFIPQLPPSSSHSSPSLVLDQRWRHRPTSVWIWAVLHEWWRHCASWCRLHACEPCF